MGTGCISQRYSSHSKAMTTESHLALRLKQQYSYTSTPPVGLYDLLYGEHSIYCFIQYDQPLHRYKHDNDTRHYTVLRSVSSYKPPIGLVSPMSYTNPSLLTLVLVQRPGLWGHQISCPLTTSWGGGHDRHGLLAKIKGKNTTPAVNQPADCIR
jgi:hypothetical protein